MFGEDLPVETNRVTLDPEVTDSSGLPAAHVVWEPHENDIALSNYGIERIFDATRAVGAVETNDTGVIHPPQGWHLMGTCRMGNTPEDSVLNKWNQTWDVPNLFVVDGTALTTGGAVKPDLDDRRPRGALRRVHPPSPRRHHHAEDDAEQRRGARPVAGTAGGRGPRAPTRRW